MTPNTIFISIIIILIVNFIFDKILGHLNATRFGNPIPKPLEDVYDLETYKKSQAYKRAKYNFGLLSSSVTFVAILAFFFLNGFAYVDSLSRSISANNIVVALLFFGIILLASELLSLPFSYYSTFVIEEKFGFNKTSKTTFFVDMVKGWILLALVGGGILALIIWLYQTVGSSFWIYGWAFMAVFSVVMNMFYAKLIVPIFNKQTPLEEGSLRSKIEAYSNKVGFQLDNIFVINGSKRSTKANAYFSGFGKEKRITLYDTLISDLDEEEIVAVLAHEVGHYKKNHILINLMASIATTGLTLWLLSLFVGSQTLASALGAEPSFHIGLIAFGVLYSPISEVTGLLMNYLSRIFEYQADDYAKKTYAGKPLLAALKKLSANSLSNLTPHPAYEFMNYSHPTLFKRYKNLQTD